MWIQQNRQVVDPLGPLNYTSTEFSLRKCPLKWEAEDIVSKICVSLEVNTKYFLI